MEENFPDNYCLTPTRGCNILDLIVSNDPGLIGQVYTLISNGISDLLEVSINHPYTQQKKSGPREVPYSTIFHQYDLNNADHEDWMRYAAE